jgi:MFS transporter, CP family, cyanate transporter
VFVDAGRDETRGAGLLLVVAVCLVAANMRITITGVGPLLDQIGADFPGGAAVLGALASVPLLAWAVVSPAAGALGRRFGMNRTLLWSLVALALGTIWRSLPGSPANLWLGTVLIGAALAIGNVLMPAVIKRDFPGRVPAVMAVYTALLAGMGAVASGIVVPISQAPLGDGTLGWRGALLWTGALVPFAILAWILANRGRRELRPALEPGRRSHARIWLDGVAWLVAGYMGLQSVAFYILLTWLAPISVSTGRSPVLAGLDVMAFQIFCFAGTLCVPLLLRGRLRRWVPAMLPVVGGLAVVGLLLSPDALFWWSIPLGLASGAMLSMSLTLMAERARDHATSAALSGMSQSVGYGVAAVGPIAFGALHSLTGGWTAPLVLLALVMAGQLVVGVAVGRDRLVRPR